MNAAFFKSWLFSETACANFNTFTNYDPNGYPDIFFFGLFKLRKRNVSSIAYCSNQRSKQLFSSIWTNQKKKPTLSESLHHIVARVHFLVSLWRLTFCGKRARWARWRCWWQPPKNLVRTPVFVCMCVCVSLCVCICVCVCFYKRGRQTQNSDSSYKEKIEQLDFGSSPVYVKECVWARTRVCVRARERI